MAGDSFQERQEGERAVLKSIYHHEIQEIITNKNIWSPLECILTLGPQTCEQPSSNAPKVDLHIICSYEYPKDPPKIKLEKWKRISNYKINILEKELQELARKRQGEVMIHELAQYTMDFLADHFIDNGDLEHASFYEEMMARRKKDEEEQIQNRKANEEKKREKMLIEFNQSQAAVKKALRRRYHSDRTHDNTDDDDAHQLTETKQNNNNNIHSNIDNMEELQFDEIPGINICPDDDFTWNLKSYHSRFENEFEHIKRLGKGAFGDVLKVKNKLDGGLYAVKKIKLDPSENKLNRKTIREAKLLSRLNHENVVRYYNSWIETNDESKTLEKRNKTPVLKNLNQRTLELLPHNEANYDWDVDKTSESTDEESSDDYILFKSLSNEAKIDNNSTIDSGTGNTDREEGNIDFVQYLYIQMELCDKSTLRIAIDDNLYSDDSKVWRLFREIVEGLCHIHQQGIIHRDLKPVNIFIGYDEHVKIGDFGLATTIALQKQTNKEIGQNIEIDKNDINFGQSDVSRTGQVGTTLYRAPELNGSAKFPYTQKVDIYSLGVILFEMCHPPFKTGMERCETIMDLRQENPIFPEDFKYNEESYHKKIIRKMLNYDVKERPTSQQLLQSPFLPPPKMEEAEVKNKVRMTLLKPQSKDYKYLIASCFNQRISPTLDATYNIYSWRSGWFTRSLETVSETLRTIFQHHGATSFLPPLLTPAEQTCDAAVCLMTRLGTIVYATHDLQMPFARYLAHNPNVTYLKRYALDKVYRERPAGIHPKEIYQAAFDIVTPALGGLMPEYEMLCVIWKILTEFSNHQGKNVELHLNHSHLISAMLKHSGLDESIQESICTKIFKMKNSHSRQEIDAFLQSLGLPERTVNSLTNWMEIGGSLNKVRSHIELSIRNDEVSSLIESGLQQLSTIINFCKIIGFTCPIIINLGFIKNAHHYSGLMCQVLIDQKNKVKSFERISILNGGRYDHLIGKLRNILPRNEVKLNQFVTGFTLSIDKLIASLTNTNKSSITEVLVCAMGDILMTPDKLVLLKDLWKSGIKTSFLNTMHSLEEIQEHCREVGIPVIVLLKESEPGYARVRIITKDKYYEKKVQYTELIEYIKKNKNSNEINTLFKPEFKSLPSIEGPNIIFILNEKLNPNTKRRYESQILNNLSRVFQRFSTQTKIEVFALFLDADVIKNIDYNIDDSSSNDNQYTILVKKYPKHKKIFYKVKDHLNDLKQSLHTFVVILYNVTDNIYKILI